ncbi:MAG: DUF1318 domain-containing protein [Woeseia sp.]
MTKVLIAITTLLVVLVTACVTINVYFPEAQAEQAADRIIDKVRGEQDGPGAFLRRNGFSEPVMIAAARQVSGFFISEAKAQADLDFDKPSAVKTALENSLASRFKQLRPFYDSGAIGMNESGTIEIRDRNLVPLKDRNSLLQLVAAQNNDWNALYAEIATLNGHPEWADNIRRIFASRWVAKADAGWWYKDGGNWKQK